MDWYLKVLKSYATFEGRARRKEYWMFFLVNFLITIGLLVVDIALFHIHLLSTLYGLAVLIPSIAVAVRRMHDSDRAGWWLLIMFVPAVGWLIVVVLLALEGTRGSNRFGPSPVAEPLALSY